MLLIGYQEGRAACK